MAIKRFASKPPPDTTIIRAVTRYLEAIGAGCDDREAARLCSVAMANYGYAQTRLERAIAWRIETIDQEKMTMPPAYWRAPSEIEDPEQRARYMAWREENKELLGAYRASLNPRKGKAPDTAWFRWFERAFGRLPINPHADAWEVEQWKKDCPWLNEPETALSPEVA